MCTTTLMITINEAINGYMSWSMYNILHMV